MWGKKNLEAPVAPRHIHTWEESERFYAPPIQLDKADRISEYTIQTLVLGLTTILYRCDDCSDIRTEQLLGKALA